ncbi:protein of unknown function [Streptococcus thermophilus]|nr:protein of unknown function [Streptococcus thermophilus]CAD0180380.1 protein of unknown function [Streptococcus thermophilus]
MIAIHYFLCIIITYRRKFMKNIEDSITTAPRTGVLADFLKKLH